MWKSFWFWEVSHCEALSHQGSPNRLAGSSTHHTHQHMASQMHQRGHRDLQTWHCSTGHRFVHQQYLATPTMDRRIFYNHNTPPDWGISYIPSKPPSLPQCLLTTDSVQWAHTPLPPLQGSQSHTVSRTNPVFTQSSSSRLKRQLHLPESGILLMMIRAYWSKCQVQN